jgi:hypothetical protein
MHLLHKDKLISVDLIVCSSILQRLQHILENASLRTSVNRARYSA